MRQNSVSLTQGEPGYDGKIMSSGTAIFQPPKFIRGNVQVQSGEAAGDYSRELISPDGIYGLRWPPFVPAKHFGKIVDVKLEISAQSRLHRFEVPALVIHESSMRTERMGLKFRHRDEATRERLAALIQSHGHYPVEHTRKFPRIPSAQFTGNFEIRAYGIVLPSALNPSPHRIRYRVSNLSPEGILLQTHDGHAHNIRAGDLIDLILEAGEAPAKDKTTPQAHRQEIHTKVKVFRRQHEIDFASQKEQWLFGLQFHRIDEATRRKYFKMLEGILTRLKSAA